MRQSICLQCNKEFQYGRASTGKFCSRVCNGLHKYSQHKTKFFVGELKRIDRATARKYLAEDRGYKCEVCGLSEWQGKSITLQVDHINGDPSNDNPSNLRLICPNCHSQTPFLGNGNKGRGRGALGLSRR